MNDYIVRRFTPWEMDAEENAPEAEYCKRQIETSPESEEGLEERIE